MHRTVRHTALAIAVATILITPHGCTRTRTDAAPDPATTTPATPTWQPTALALPEDVHVSYARIDSTDGTVMLGGDIAMHPLDQLTTPGLIADYLQILSDRGENATDTIDRLAGALAGTTDDLQWLTDQVGGEPAAMRRIIDACQLEDTQPVPAEATTLDTARYAACLREGAITDADRSAWLINLMRSEKNGIGEHRGAGQLAQHNSTVRDGDNYRTGCLAVAPYWSAAVATTYPAGRGQPYGVAVCALVSQSVFPPDTLKAPEGASPTMPSR